MNSIRLLVLAVAAALAVPVAAQARSEQGIFTVELAGSYSAGWASPGVPSCSQSDPMQMRGQIHERGSFRTREPVPITVQGLWGRDITHFTMRDVQSGETGIPVDAEIVRTGHVERVMCKQWDELPKSHQRGQCNTDVQQQTDPECSKVVPIAGQEGCFGERRFSGLAGLSLNNVGTSAPGHNINSELFSCPDDDVFKPGDLIPGNWEGIGPKSKGGGLRFKSAKAGAKWTVTMRDTKPCRQPAPATCTPAVMEATATFRFVCRSPTSFKGCLTPKLRRKLKLGREWGPR